MDHGGVAKIARNGFTTFGKADGFSWPLPYSKQGPEIFLWLARPAAESGSSIGSMERNSSRTRPDSLSLLRNMRHGWGWNQTVLEDHTGEWWVATFRRGLPVSESKPPRTTRSHAAEGHLHDPRRTCHQFNPPSVRGFTRRHLDRHGRARREVERAVALGA